MHRPAAAVTWRQHWGIILLLAAWNTGSLSLKMNFRWINSLLWGNSVALAWMWGLGLFFSVQMTFMFGLQGLLLFAVPNALGLMLFGLLTQIVAKRHAGGQESLALFFDKFSKPFRLIFYLYQVLALTLTVFALTRYLFAPLELVSGPITALYLCMVVFVVLAAGCLFGEEFGIQRIKFGHGMLGGLLLACVVVVLFSLNPLLPICGRLGDALFDGGSDLGERHHVLADLHDSRDFALVEDRQTGGLKQLALRLPFLRRPVKLLHNEWRLVRLEDNGMGGGAELHAGRWIRRVHHVSATVCGAHDELLGERRVESRDGKIFGVIIHGACPSMRCACGRGVDRRRAVRGSRSSWLPGPRP